MSVVWTGWLPAVAELLNKSLAAEEAADNLLTQIAREFDVRVKERISETAETPVVECHEIGGDGLGGGDVEAFTSLRPLGLPDAFLDQLLLSADDLALAFDRVPERIEVVIA